MKQLGFKQVKQVVSSRSYYNMEPAKICDFRSCTYQRFKKFPVSNGWYYR